VNPVQDASKKEQKTIMTGPMSQAKKPQTPVIRSEIGHAG
jgi:hypothetical protein